MFDGQKFASGTKLKSVVLQWFGQQPTSFLHREFRSLVTDETNCLNEIKRYADK